MRVRARVLVVGERATAQALVTALVAMPETQVKAMLALEKVATAVEKEMVTLQPLAKEMGQATVKATPNWTTSNATAGKSIKKPVPRSRNSKNLIPRRQR